MTKLTLIRSGAGDSSDSEGVEHDVVHVGLIVRRNQVLSLVHKTVVIGSLLHLRPHNHIEIGDLDFHGCRALIEDLKVVQFN